MIHANISSSGDLADWIELSLLKANVTHYSVQQIESLALEWTDKQVHEVTFALQIMKKRSQGAGAGYPFEVNAWAVTAKQGARGFWYSMMLLMSRSSATTQILSSQPTPEEAELFEEFSAMACEAYLGRDSTSRLFGWPSKCGRPQVFHEAMSWLALEMGVDLGNAFKPSRRKDGGVDVVVWRNFPDAKRGFQILLVQATLQDAIMNKSRDIDIRLWGGWLDLDRDPVTVLTTPRATFKTHDWNEASLTSIVLDRCRLSYLVPGSNEVALEYVTSKLGIQGDHS